MISVFEAKDIIEKKTVALPPRKTALAAAAGLVLAEDLYSPINIPAFPQSSMDGYAFAFHDWKAGNKLSISGTIAAGNAAGNRLLPGNAARIFTGAAVPEGADTVVMQEKTKAEKGELIINDPNIQRGDNVRPVGLEIKKGMLALAKNSLLNPAAIGLLASMGIHQAAVYPCPTVSIIITGDELQQPGSPLSHGQVYDANSFSLSAALQQQGIDNIRLYHVKDSLETLTKQLQQVLEDSDVVFLSGGISVGDFDFVLRANLDNGVEQLFHKIKQRPAKPLFFGKKENRYVFGLPGNPASGLTSFFEYALPCLGILMNKNISLKKLTVPLGQSFSKPAGLTHFLKGYYNGTTAMVLEGQESFRLSSFAKANCLIQIDEAVTGCKEGEAVEIHLLP